MTERPQQDQWYVVIKAGAKLRGWQYAGQSSFASVGCDLVIQDRLLYVGSRTIGSDSFPEDYFRCERTGIEGALTPGSWGSADMSYLAPLESEPTRYQMDCDSIIRSLKGAGLDAAGMYPLGVEVGDEHWDMMIDEDDGVWRIGLYVIIDNVIGDEPLIMREVVIPDRGGSAAGGTHVENHISRLLDVTDAALEVWESRLDRQTVAGALLDKVAEQAPEDEDEDEDDEIEYEDSVSAFHSFAGEIKAMHDRLEVIRATVTDAQPDENENTGYISGLLRMAGVALATVADEARDQF